MFKTLFFGALILFSLNTPAQTSKIDIPMKKGKVYYERSYRISDSSQQNELFKRAEKWFKQDFPNTQKIKISADKTTGEITGTGIFKIVTSNTGNYYFMRFAITIKVYNSGYTYTADKFYEKPIESGISNEYSKIEYRWWDYRQGKPWSKEDETLFKGIASNETALMASLEDEMNNR
ncbi:protein of unknown function [Mucilaginibacter mallensis]|uniref:DUF4468 domain-containing protein n=1 Tax=Mucilaginibacter mallensis TaxID=652787 RepID=A0A1H1WTJ9_MUCMA|nr:DUF4468 domain-containing protein [Mucilaginibacter mallensis]SDT00434.1 protein of unknown function [Mucilaginibacter mallensis]